MAEQTKKKKNNKEFWKKQVLAWEKSGISQVQFAKRRGLQSSSLSYWSRKLQKDVVNKELKSISKKGQLSINSIEFKKALETERYIEIVIATDKNITIKVHGDIETTTLTKLITSLKEVVSS